MMTVKLESNSTNDEMELDITVEADEGVFLSFTGKDVESGEDVLDFIATDKGEIEEFFLMVARARVAYERQTL